MDFGSNDLICTYMYLYTDSVSFFGDFYRRYTALLIMANIYMDMHSLL